MIKALKWDEYIGLSMRLALSDVRGGRVIFVLLLWLVYGYSMIVHAVDKPHHKSSQKLTIKSINSKLLDNSSASKLYSLQETDDHQVKIYQYQDDSGITVFADHAPEIREYQIILYDCYACRPDSELDWNTMPLYPKNFDSLILLAAKEHQLDPALIRAVIHAESGFNVLAISKAGAMGLMQLMPDTAADLGVKNAFKAEQNINAGAKYLARMLKLFDGNIELACAAYNAGPTVVTQYQGLPPYPETIAYVERIKILLKRYQNLTATMLVGGLR